MSEEGFHVKLEISLGLVLLEELGGSQQTSKIRFVTYSLIPTYMKNNKE